MPTIQLGKLNITLDVPFIEIQLEVANSELALSIISSVINLKMVLKAKAYMYI